jgi:hypothetical protein
MGQTQRPMPVRSDRWRPEDPVLDAIIRRCISNAESLQASESSSEFMAGAVVLALLAGVLLVALKSVQAAIIVPALLAAAGLGYVLTKAPGAQPERHDALAVMGGPGRLPAGYLVHEQAWEAGVGQHVAKVPESQLRACAELCRQFPGTVDDLLGFTGTIASHIALGNHPAATVERRTRELVRIAEPILREHLVRNPMLPVAAGGTKKKR